MKIALFVDQFPKLSETFILNQIDGLFERGHEVTIFACQHSGETRLQGIIENRHLMDVTRYPVDTRSTFLGKVRLRFHLAILGMKYAKAIARLRKAFTQYPRIGSWRTALMRAEPLLRHENKFDLLFAHFGPNGLRANWYRDAGLVDAPLVTVFHGFDLSTYLNHHNDQVYEPLFRNGDLFLPISRYWQEKLVAIGCPPERTRVHHVGIDCEQFAFQPRTYIKGEPVVLISVVRLVEKKGVEYAIRAMIEVVASGKPVSYRIIGDGPLLVPLRDLVTQLKLNDHISFLGTKTSEEVTEELAGAQLFLAPSVESHSGDMEGIPTVLMEAMATGMPVISTWHSGIPELVEDGVSGTLVGEREENELARAITTLMDFHERWAAMGQFGRQKVLEEFNIQTLNTRLDTTFKALCGAG
ncbi:MAG TPA: colanic acid biosynthesis glycosyltransferase WcaL [Gammaproteobacteria bacterium]|nr:colanic acid biosynthesis glycosyltransferase WcaL [Gammaproteobacteria bacterium]